MKNFYLFIVTFMFAISMQTNAQITVPYDEDFETSSGFPTAGDWNVPPGTTSITFSQGGDNTVGVNSFLGAGIITGPATTNLNNGLNRIRFMLSSSFSSGFVEVGTMSDRNDANTFSPIQTINVITDNMDHAYTVEIGTTGGSNEHVAIRFRDNGPFTGGNYVLDDIFVEPIPACEEVQNITVSNIMGTSADVSWTVSVSGEAAWEYVVQLAGTGEPSTSGDPVTTMPMATAMSLTGNTNYEVYVRANCTAAGDGFGAWVGPVNFTTLCTNIVDYYNETGFNNDLTTACWTEFNSGDIAAGPSGSGSNWTFGYNYHDSEFGQFNPSYILQMNDSTLDQWLVSPMIDGNEFNLPMDVLNIRVAATNFSSSFGNLSGTANIGPDQEVSLLVSRDGGAWSVLETWNESLDPGTGGATFTFPLTGETGILQFAFYGTSGTSTGGEEWAFHVGHFEIDDAPLNTIDLLKQAKIEVYPNPVTDILYIKSENEIKNVEITASNGKRVLNSTSNKIDVQRLNPGVYFIQIATKNGLIENSRFIKK